MTFTLAVDPAEVTYLDTTRLIDYQVSRFYKEYGKEWVTRLLGPFEEVRSQADLFFMHAYDSYDASIATFNTHLGYKVWKGLLSMLRNEIKRRKRSKLEDRELEELSARPMPEFRLQEFMHKLPEDAREVVRLICIDTPIEVYVTMAQNKLRGQTPAAMREAVREYLRDMGWAAVQVTTSFKQITEALYA